MAVKDLININFTTAGISKLLSSEKNISTQTPGKKDILAVSGLLTNVKVQTKPPLGFCSIPELVGIDYVGYIIEKERLNKDTGEWTRTDEYKIIGSRAISFKDTRVAYGETYRYRAKSVLKFTVKQKKDTVSNFDFLEDLKNFVNEKVKEDFDRSTDLVENADSLFNKGLAIKTSSGEEKQEINITDKFSIVFEKDNSTSIIDKEEKKKIFIPFNKKKDLFNVQLLSGLSSKVNLKEILNNVVKSKTTEEVAEYEHISYYYTSRPGKSWIYVDIVDLELPAAPVITKIIPNSTSGNIIIYWTKPITFKRNVRFFNLYRRNTLGQSWEKIASNLSEDVNFYIDKDVEVGKKYIYAMTVVDVHKIESFLSTQIQAELNPNIASEREEKKLKWISGPGASLDDLSVVFRKFFTRDENLVAKRNIFIKPNTKFDENSKDFIVRIRSLDTHEEFDLKLTLKNIKEK